MCGEDDYLYYSSQEMAERGTPQDYLAMLWHGFAAHWHITKKSVEVPSRFVNALSRVMEEKETAFAANVIVDWLFWYFYVKAEEHKNPKNSASEIFTVDFAGFSDKLTTWLHQNREVLELSRVGAGTHANSWLASEKILNRVHEFGGSDFLNLDPNSKRNRA
jgi:hypothetical protein